MIEVTCQQARRWIREARDRRIPEEQWALLQAHLETCPSCRAYQVGLESIEHNLGRVLGSRWQPVRDSLTAPGLSGTIRKYRRARAVRLKWAGYAALGLLALALLGGFRVYWRVTAPPAPTSTPAGQARAELWPTPTRAPGAFRGTLALETHRYGNAEIELLLPGKGGLLEWSNLTENSADDTSPAWSPDGEWIAFLSDRNGKDEVYVISIAGSRLTQLTNSAGVTWQGPLAWSADGQWLALRGVPAGSDIPAIYLIPINGQGARSLAFSRGALGPPVFSPQSLALVFQHPMDVNSLLLYDLQAGQFTSPTQDDNENDWMQTGVGEAYDWSPVQNRATRLAYLAEGPFNPFTSQASQGSAVTQLRVTREILAGNFDRLGSAPSQVVESVPGKGALRGVAWSPGREDSLLAYLREDEDQPGCWQLHLHRPDPLQVGAVIPGLCVDQAPDRSSWTTDGSWIVLLAHRPAEMQAAYYAVQIPSNPFIAGPGSFLIERLADGDVEAQAAASAPVVRVRPRLPNDDSELQILPRVVQPPVPTGEPSIPPPALPGRLVYSISGPVSDQLVSMLPDGGSRSMLTEALHQYSCPVWSPDGKTLAYLSDSASAARGVMEVYRADADGSRPIQLTQPIFPVDSNKMQGYGCPVWSPDGQHLAAVLRTTSYARLAIIPNPPDHWTAVPPTTYLEVGNPSALTGPVWNPDGQQLVLPVLADAHGRTRILSVDVAQDPPRIHTMWVSDGGQDIYGLTFSPDGAEIAFITTRYIQNQGVSFQLHKISRTGRNLMNRINLPGSDMNSWMDLNPLQWLPAGRLAFLIRHRPDALYKTDLYLLDPAQPGAIQPLLRLPDMVFDLAWSPGKADWLVYSSDSGLYALDAAAVEARRQVAPVLLSADRAYELDWSR